ncbi:MAG: hypothetical protein HYS04_09855 [Acidobacteria bacterium]|nr:hypothetical protein [Acidobacteriota bacterium]
MLLLFNFSGASLATHNTMLTWEGQVSAPVTLYVRGDRVDADSRSFDAVSRTSYRFTEPLPAGRQRVTVSMREGSGRVRVLQQPNPRNDYTLAVRVDPRGHGSEFYRLEFQWEPEGERSSVFDRRTEPYGTRSRVRDIVGAGQVTWSGRVDHEAIVNVMGNRATATTVRGRAVSDMRFDMTAPLPRAPVTVDVIERQGRGVIELMEQPSATNGYAAKIRLYDPEGGDAPYSFTLAWNGESRAVFGQSQSGGFGGANRILWSGRVDGRVRVHFQGSRTWVERLSGGPPDDVRADFGSPLPRASQVNFDMRRLRGRDEVNVVELPSSPNGYTLVVEIDDSSSGADDYEIQVTW